MEYYPICRIPLIKGKKIPLPSRWQEMTPEDAIWARIFSENPGCNVGIRLDHLVVIDCDTPAMVTWWLEQGYPTDFESQGDPTHRSFWYRRPDDCDLQTSRHAGWEIRTGAGAQCVVPPSIHPLGMAYEWLGQENAETPMCVCERHWAEIPGAPIDALLDLQATHVMASDGVDGWDAVLEGEGRDNLMAGLAGFWRSRGASLPLILANLRASNQLACLPPLPDPDLTRIARSISRYEQGQELHMEGGGPHLIRRRSRYRKR